MSKSRLSTVEILSRRDTGVSIAEIAQEARVTQTAVRRRLIPESDRCRIPFLYSSLDEDERRDRTAAKREKRRRDQDKSARQAHKKGMSWSQEDLAYLRENGGFKTALELALDLGRTYYSVLDIIKKKKISLEGI